ncbi:hypothetical protein [Hoeflea alexandrii]
MRNKLGEIALGLVLLAAIVVGAWYAASWLFRGLLGIDKTLANGIIAALVAIFSIIFAYWRDREKSRQEAHREKKVEVYKIFFDLIFKILRDSKKKDKDADGFLESDEFQDAFFELMKGVLAYGSPDVVKSIGNWRVHADSSGSNQMKMIGDILLSMRKDLGLSNSGLTNINIHQVYVNDDIETVMKGSTK